MYDADLVGYHCQNRQWPDPERPYVPLAPAVISVSGILQMMSYSPH
jgi:hypothetical protein